MENRILNITVYPLPVADSKMFSAIEMKKKDYLTLLLVILAFSGCRSIKMQLEEIGTEDFCKAKHQLLIRLQSDKKLKDHFGINDENAKFHVDSVVQNGVPFFFLQEYSEYRAGEKNISHTEAYQEVQLELLQSRNKKYKTHCLENTIERKDAEIKITFWYTKNGKWVTLDAINILNTPGYSLGYLYLVRIDDKGKLINIAETSWQE